MMRDSGHGTITIVSGLPRSGTSLMMQMLAAGGVPLLTDQIRTADEDNPRSHYEFEPVKQTRQDPGWLHAAVGKAVKMVYLLLYDLPACYHYRVIFMNRRLPEVLASQRALLLRQGKNGAALPDDRLAQVFEIHLRKLARWPGEQEHFAVLPVSYNELVADPAGPVTQIIRFLGDGLQPSAMVKAVDPALYRHRLSTKH